MDQQKQQIIHISFNQDQSYFAIGTQKGFRVFKLGNQITQEINREFGAGIGIVQMVHKTNIFALVGGGRTPRYPKNKLMIWDDSTLKCIVQTNCKSQVKAVRIKIDRCIVILQTKIFVFNLADFRMLQSIQTCPNPKGLCSMSTLREDLILAYPSKKIGFVEILSETHTQRKKIQAHKSPLCALKLCPNGYKMATASQKGTLIRIFDIQKCQCIQQLRRGSQYATIYSIAFDTKSKWLACSSDSGTIHIFALKPTQQQTDKDQSFTKNKKSKLSILSKISSYFDSQWSFALFRTTEKITKIGFIGSQNQIAVVSTTGSINIVKFDAQKGGQCVKMAQFNIFASRE